SPTRWLPQPSAAKQQITTQTQSPQSGMGREGQDRRERQNEPGFSIQWTPSIPVVCLFRIFLFFVLLVFFVVIRTASFRRRLKRAAERLPALPLPPPARVPLPAPPRSPRLPPRPRSRPAQAPAPGAAAEPAPRQAPRRRWNACRRAVSASPGSPGS